MNERIERSERAGEKVGKAFGYVFGKLGPKWRVTRARKVEHAGRASIGDILRSKVGRG